MKVEISRDEQDRVVRNTLKKTIDSLYKEKALVLKRQKGHMFSMDANYDIWHIDNLIETMCIVHNFFSTEYEYTKDNCTEEIQKFI